MPLFTNTSGKTSGGAGNNPQLPTDYCRTSQGAYRNIFFVGETISFPLRGGLLSDQNSYLAPGTPNSWEIRHGITGAVVASGGALPTVSEGYVWTPLSGGSPLSLPCGPYIIAFSRAASIAIWGFVQGGGSFVVVRNTAGFPSRPAAVEVGQFFQDDVPLHGLLGMGTTRVSFDNNSLPVSNQYSNADAAVTALGTYLANDTTARPKPLLIAFPNYVDSTQHRTDVTATVARYAGSVLRYENRNEPSTSGYTGAQWATYQQGFYNAVKAGSSSAIVCGPCPVVIGGSNQGLAWLEGFAAAGGYAYCDEITVHTYNGTLGDLTLARRTWDGFLAHLTKWGQQGKARWVTEGGDFWGSPNGSGTPVKQQQELALDLMVCEQYGVPKERYIYYYDQMAGFEAQPGHLLNYGRQPTPAVAMWRCYSEELYGTTYESRLDFGPVENNWMIGSTHRRADTTGVAAILSCGLPGHTVTLSLTGGSPSSVTVVDQFGNSSTAAVSAGKVSFDASDTGPVYVRLPAGVSAAVVQNVYGWDLALSEAATSARNPGGAIKLNDGTFRSSYYFDSSGIDPDGGGDLSTPWNGLGTATGTPETAQITFGHAQTFDTVVVQSPFFYQRISTLLDFDVQWLDADGVTWHTISTFTKSPLVVTRASTWYDRFNAFTETYDNAQHVWRFTFPKVTSRSVRVYIRATTAGGEAAAGCVDAGGGSGQGWTQGFPYIQAIKVFNAREAINPTRGAVRLA